MSILWNLYFCVVLGKTKLTIKSKIYHRVLPFRDITHWKSWNWTNCRYFSNKTVRKGRMQQWQFFVTQGPLFWLCWFSNCLNFETILQMRCCRLTQIKIRYIADMRVEKWTKIAPIFLIKQLPNIVKSMSISLYFVRMYYSGSWIWSHFQKK